MPRQRFTIRGLMITAGVVALALAGELKLFDLAVAHLDGGPTPTYVWYGAVQLWVIMNVPIFFLVCCLYLAFRYRNLGRSAPSPTE